MLTKEQFKTLKSINVSSMLEKKGKYDYLSWSYAIGLLLENDPEATWEFLEPKIFGDTMMTFCKVSAFGKTHVMHLPVMDFSNNAQSNPDARDVSDTMMRCLVKCIATFGIGLNVYSGDALPEENKGNHNVNKIRNENSQKSNIKIAKPSSKATGLDANGNSGLTENDVPNWASESVPDFIPPKQNGEYVINFGNKYKGKRIKDISFEELDSYANYCIEYAQEKGVPLTPEVTEFMKALYGN